MDRGEPGGLQSMGSQRVGYDCATFIHSLALTRIPTGLRGSILYTHLALAPPYSPMNFILSLLVKCKDVYDLSHILFGIIHLEK